MDTNTKQALWEQFGAAIDTLENAMHACPDDLWYDRTTSYPEYWATVHHTLFWLDYYLTDPDEKFTPPSPIGLEELDPAGRLPEKPYTKEEMQTYLEYGRKKCRTTIETLTDEKANHKIKFGKVDLSFVSLMLYNLRHVQHHAAQLNLILRQTIDSAPGWVFKAKNDYDDQ
jgi:hypothetical protein